MELIELEAVFPAPGHPQQLEWRGCPSPVHTHPLTSTFWVDNEEHHQESGRIHRISDVFADPEAPISPVTWKAKRLRVASPSGRVQAQAQHGTNAEHLAGQSTPLCGAWNVEEAQYDHPPGTTVKSQRDDVGSTSLLAETVCDKSTYDSDDDVSFGGDDEGLYAAVRILAEHDDVLTAVPSMAMAADSSLTIELDGAMGWEERSSVASSVTSEHTEAAEDAGSEEENAQEQEEHGHGHEQEEEEIITPATRPSHLPRDHVQHLNTHGLGLPTASPVSDSTDQFCC
jgi:hypothetical protein